LSGLDFLLAGEGDEKVRKEFKSMSRRLRMQKEKYEGSGESELGSVLCDEPVDSAALS
jgi:hypothetical protein